MPQRDPTERFDGGISLLQRENDALRARVAELEAALDEIFLRSMSSTCTFNEIQTIVSHAKG